MFPAGVCSRAGCRIESRYCCASSVSRVGRRLLRYERGFRLLQKVAVRLIEKHGEEFAQLDHPGKRQTDRRRGDAGSRHCRQLDRVRYAGWTTKILGDTIPLSLPLASSSTLHHTRTGLALSRVSNNRRTIRSPCRSTRPLPAIATGQYHPSSSPQGGHLARRAAAGGSPFKLPGCPKGYSTSSPASASLRERRWRITTTWTRLPFTRSTDVGRILVRRVGEQFEKGVARARWQNRPISSSPMPTSRPTFKGAYSWASFFVQGEICASPVPGSSSSRGIYDEFVERLAAMARSVTGSRYSRPRRLTTKRWGRSSRRNSSGESSISYELVTVMEKAVAQWCGQAPLGEPQA